MASAPAGATPGRMQMLSVAIENGTPIDTTRVRFEFDQPSLPNLACLPLRCYDVAPDGQSFFVIQRHP